MKTNHQKYPRHRFTAETFLRIEELHHAAAELVDRSGRHYADGNIKRGVFCQRAAWRLQKFAFVRGMLALSARELNRLCVIQQAKADAEKAKAAA